MIPGGAPQYVLDDDDEIQEISTCIPPSVSLRRVNTHSNQVPPNHPAEDDIRSHLQKNALKIADIERRQAELDFELQEAEDERRTLLEDLNVSQVMNGHTTGSNDAFDAIDYSTQSFEWSEDLKRKMKQVWDISEFRMCQRGVCNAVMDGRDVVCIMPTGGGKSLTYQLPALMTPGCTVVISPLISLMTDQTLHLQEVNIRAVMLSGTTSQAETREVYDRLLQRYDERDGSERIKLLYVTPEKIVKNKKLTSVLEKMAHAGSLDRIVIDEAHCVSQLGHDYRPDYAKLTSLRKMLPSVPILAVSATCPPRVLVDVLKILGLDRLTNGNAANGTGTVHFSAPLFRPNLLYQVVVKGSSGHRVIQDIANYILTRHKLDSGIVYCLTKSDAEDTASGLAKASGGIIKTGVYHSACDQRDKERLHQRWRAGEVKVICATIAFGLGIDKGDVRFVLHRSLAKTLDGFYQESGRAGRDGKNADCVLFYQPQDTWTLCSMAFQEVDGVLKLKAMLRFAQNFRDCRKKIFSKYFYEASAISSVSWSAEETPQDCKVCDNCQRPPGTTVNEAITLPAWQIFRAVAYVTDRGDQVTMKQICDLVRKKRGASDANSATGTKRRKSAVDMTVIAGGTINWPQEKLEVLIIHLWLEGYLEERFVPTEYRVNVYLALTPKSRHRLRHTREEIAEGIADWHMDCYFMATNQKKTSSTPKSAKASTSKSKKDAAKQSPPQPYTSPNWPPARPKRVRAAEDPGPSAVIHIDDSSEGEVDVADAGEEEGTQSLDEDSDSYLGADEWQVPKKKLRLQ